MFVFCMRYAIIHSHGMISDAPPNRLPDFFFFRGTKSLWRMAHSLAVENVLPPPTVALSISPLEMYG